MNKRRKVNLIIVGFLALMFFLLTSLFIFLNQPEGGYYRWSSPDESANYYFSLNYANNKQLSVYDPAGLVSKGWVAPRSMRSDLGFLKPVSFLGITLVFGSIASFLGTAVIPFLTPFFAALGVIFFYLLVENLFSKRVALYSAFLLSFFPVYIYYSIRALFHNVLFIVFLLAAFYFISSAYLKKKRKREKIDKKKEKIPIKELLSEKAKSFISCKSESRRYLSFIAVFFAGLFSGLAIITRTSELLWLAPLLFLCWVFYVKSFGLIQVIIFLSGLLLSILPVAYYNQILYGSYFYGGYNELNSSINEITQVGSNLFSRFSWQYLKESFNNLIDLIFFFGVKPLQSLKMFYAYVVQMFPLIFWPGVFGFILVFVQNIYRPKKKIRLYLLAGLLSSLFLVIYYGSWKFNDNPDISSITIGNSYTRYWLPIYLWLMPLGAWFLIHLSRTLFQFKKIGKRLAGYLRLGFESVIIFIYIISSLFFVFFGSEEGLIYWRYNNIMDRKMTERVLSLTEDESIVVTRHFDKLIFPDRRVIIASLPDGDLSLVVSDLVDLYPVYYLHFKLREVDLEYLNKGPLAPYNLRIEVVNMTSLNTQLYRLERVPEPEPELLITP